MSHILSLKDLAITWGNDTHYWRNQDNNGDERFPKVAELLTVCWLEIRGQIDSGLLARGKRYTVHLIYKLSPSAAGLGLPYYQIAKTGYNGEKRERTVYLDSENLEPYAEGNGWCQLCLGELDSPGTGIVRVQLLGSEGTHSKSGLIVAGMEFKQVNDDDSSILNRQITVRDLIIILLVWVAYKIYLVKEIKPEGS